MRDGLTFHSGKQFCADVSRTYKGRAGSGLLCIQYGQTDSAAHLRETDSLRQLAWPRKDPDAKPELLEVKGGSCIKVALNNTSTQKQLRTNKSVAGFDKI